MQDTLRSWRDSYDATCSALLPFGLPVGSMDLVILVSQVPQFFLIHPDYYRVQDLQVSKNDVFFGDVSTFTPTVYGYFIRRTSGDCKKIVPSWPKFSLKCSRYLRSLQLVYLYRREMSAKKSICFSTSPGKHPNQKKVRSFQEIHRESTEKIPFFMWKMTQAWSPSLELSPKHLIHRELCQRLEQRLG